MQLDVLISQTIESRVLRRDAGYAAGGLGVVVSQVRGWWDDPLVPEVDEICPGKTVKSCKEGYPILFPKLE